MAPSCKICRDQFGLGEKAPLQLQCNHTFCRHCLVALERSGRVRCHICRKTHTWPPVADLPVNEDMLEPLSPVPAKSGDGGSFMERVQLLQAAAEGEVEAVLKLIWKGVNTDTVSPKEEHEGRRALHLAADGGHEGVVWVLLRDHATVNAPDLHGMTALHLASQGGHVPMVTILLLHGADPSLAVRGVGLRAMHCAAVGGHVGVMKELLQHEGSGGVDQRTDDGKTPLHLAADNGNVEAIKWLLQKGADPNLKDQRGLTALDYAREERQKAVVAMLEQAVAPTASRHPGQVKEAEEDTDEENSSENEAEAEDERDGDDLSLSSSHTYEEIEERKISRHERLSDLKLEQIKHWVDDKQEKEKEKRRREEEEKRRREETEKRRREDEEKRREEALLKKEDELKRREREEGLRFRKEKEKERMRQQVEEIGGRQHEEEELGMRSEKSKDSDSESEEERWTEEDVEGQETTVPFDYEIMETLGRGDFGMNYLVMRDNTKQVMMRVDLEQIPMRARDHILKELQLLQRIQHPHIVTNLGGGSLNGFLHIFSEHCDHGNLAHRILIHRKGKIPVEESLIFEWTVSLAQALAYLHNRGVMHRDVKPENLLLGTKDRLKLGNFSFGCFLEGRMASTYIGTPVYMSPQILKGELYDTKADMWSMGCCLYEMAALQRGYPYTKVKVPGKYNKKFKSVVKELLQQDPTKRPSATEVLSRPVFKVTLEKKVVREQRSGDKLRLSSK